MFFISLFILFFAVVFVFDRFFIEKIIQNNQSFSEYIRAANNSGVKMVNLIYGISRKITKLEKRLDEIDKKYGKITNSHNSRIEKIEGFSNLEPKKNWEKFTKHDDTPNIRR